MGNSQERAFKQELESSECPAHFEWSVEQWSGLAGAMESFGRVDAKTCASVVRQLQDEEVEAGRGGFGGISAKEVELAFECFDTNHDGRLPVHQILAAFFIFC